MVDVGQVALPCTKKELIIVVGAEDYYTGSAGNRLMFMSQAVRTAKIFASAYDWVSVLWAQAKPNVFKYTEAQITAFEKAIKLYVPEEKLLFKEVKSMVDIAEQANKKTVLIDGEECNKKIAGVIFYGHGNAKSGFWLSNSNNKFINKLNVKLIFAESFYKTTSKKPKVYFYSCQTGNAGLPRKTKMKAGGEGEDITLTEIYAETFSKYVQRNRYNSVAQVAANAWKVTVQASMTQTNYSKTWSTGMSGYWDGLTGNRNLIDGKVWEEDGADGAVYSGTGSSPDNNLPTGFIKYEAK